MCFLRFILLATAVVSLFLPIKTFAENNGSQIFIKLDNQAKELPDDATEWVMVKDTRSDLIWEVKTNDDSVHNMDNLYSWKKSKKLFIKQLNDKKFGGFSDWRIPEEEELGSLVDKSKAAPYINEKYFPHTLPELYLGWVLCGDGQSINSSKIHFGDPPKEKKKQRQIRVRAVRGKGADN